MQKKNFDKMIELVEEKELMESEKYHLEKENSKLKEDLIVLEGKNEEYQKLEEKNSKKEEIKAEEEKEFKDQ